MARSTSLRAHLRQVTQELHHSAESHLGLARRTWTREIYRALLERHWGFHVPLEDALTRLDWRGSRIAMATRRKCALLAADLEYLGVIPASLSRIALCGHLPALGTLHDGLGALYVVEGSTLGGQVILAALQAKLDISPVSGGRFFASYGSGIGVMWRGYLEELETAGQAEGAAAAIERTALQTFAAFDRWFEPDLGA